MKSQKLNILLIILLALSIIINVYFFIKYKPVNQPIKTQYQITTTFMIIYPENDEIKYYNNVAKTLTEFIKSNSNKQKIYNKYGINISNNINIESINETNTVYKITISSEKQENLVNLCKEVISMLRTQETYNIDIQVIDGANEYSIIKIQ